MSITRYICGAITLLIGIALLASGSVYAQRTSSVEAALEEAGDHRGQFRVAEAEAAYQRAFDISPDDPSVTAAYGNFKRTLGEHAQAIRLLRRAGELGADNLSLLYQLGITYRYAKDYDAAARVHQRYIGLNPTAANGRLQLAYTEIVRGNRGEALRLLQVAEQIYGDGVDNWRTAQLAFNYAQLGRRQDVIRLFDRLEEMETVSQAAWAMAYIALGDYEQALQRIESAVSNPETIGGATNILYQLAANPFDDPALGGPPFQEAFNPLWGK
jgi:tetratricopeptide (TPR) repeat protein